MNKFVIKSSGNLCRKKDGGCARCIQQDVVAFYHADYQGGGKWREKGTIENLICTFKNDITKYSQAILDDAVNELALILRKDLPEILKISAKPSLRVCVIPRAKKEDAYRADQLYFRATIKNVVNGLYGFEDGTFDIIRHTDTATTHLSRNGNGGAGEMPYVGITNDTCNISEDVVGKDILLIDDLYTKTVNIDEDCIQALIDRGVRSVMFYSVGKTMLRC